MREENEEILRELEEAGPEARPALLIRLAREGLKADPDRAAERAQEALDLARDLDEPLLESEALDALGMCRLEKGDCVRAQRCLLEALRILHRHGDDTSVAGVRCNLGLAHFVWGDHEKAEECFGKSLDTSVTLGDAHTEARARNGLGMILAQREDHDGALAHFLRALEISREQEGSPGVVPLLNNIGLIHLSDGRPAEAEPYLEESYESKKQAGDRRGTAGSLINLGMVKLRLGEHETARRLIDDGIRLAEGAETLEFVVHGVGALRTLADETNDLALGKEAADRYVEARMALFDEEKSRQIAEMQVRYDTERAAREAELGRLREQELSEQLRQAQRMEIVGRLAGGVAHDFNNLLTVISCSAELMLMSLGENHPLRPRAKEIRGATERAASLTRQLLAFSRKQILHPCVLDLSRVVSGLTGMVHRLLGPDIEFRTELAPDLDPVFADEGQFEQIIVNLAINARDAMPDGGLLTIATKNLDAGEAPQEILGTVDPGPLVLTTVEATGTGMSAEVVEHIFEPFFTTKSVDKGTGLGLATVHGIVHQSGGAIGVDSEPDRGTRFSIYLPRSPGDIPEPAPTAASAAPARGEETVLLVEDDDPVRDLTEECLKIRGYRVLPARTAERALRRAEEHEGTIHLLLTDVMLPGMNGVELAGALREVRPDVRVLYMSGHSTEVLAPGEKSLIDPLVEKPFGQNLLARRVREVLDD